MLSKLQGAPAHTRPFAIEALLRAGEDRQAVVDAFNPTPEEMDRVVELLAGQSIAERIANGA